MLLFFESLAISGYTRQIDRVKRPAKVPLSASSRATHLPSTNRLQGILKVGEDDSARSSASKGDKSGNPKRSSSSQGGFISQRGRGGARAGIALFFCRS